MSETTNEELAAALAEIAVVYEIEDREHDAVMVQEAIDRLRDDVKEIDQIRNLVEQVVDQHEAGLCMGGVVEQLSDWLLRMDSIDKAREAIDKARKA